MSAFKSKSLKMFTNFKAHVFVFLQDMQAMKNCYDSLLSAAAATANSAYGRAPRYIYPFGDKLVAFGEKNG